MQRWGRGGSHGFRVHSTLGLGDKLARWPPNWFDPAPKTGFLGANNDHERTQAIAG